MVTKRDGLATLFLLAAFAPLYLIHIDIFPYRINFDEIETLNVQKSELQSNSRAPLGLMANLDYHPRMMFLLEGWLADHLGGINLSNGRRVGALSGLMIIGISFLLFRTTLSFWDSLGAALILGSSS